MQVCFRAIFVVFLDQVYNESEHVCGNKLFNKLRVHTPQVGVTGSGEYRGYSFKC